MLRQREMARTATLSDNAGFPPYICSLFFRLRTWNVLTSVTEELFLRLAAKGDGGFTEDGVAVVAIIRGFPVLTGLTEPKWCWVSIQAAGLGHFVVLISPL